MKMKMKLKAVALKLLWVLAAIVGVPVLMLLVLPFGALGTGVIVFIEELANDYGNVWRSIRNKPREHKRVMWVPIGSVGEIYWFLANRERIYESFPEGRDSSDPKQARAKFLASRERAAQQDDHEGSQR